MKNLLLIFVALITISCSFDNKTGIWKDASSIPVDNQVVNTIEENQSERKYVDTSEQSTMFNDEVDASSGSILKLDNPVVIDNWNEQYGSITNNISSISHSGPKTLISRSSKLSKFSRNKNIVFYKNDLITFDHKGRIFIYSAILKKKVYIYNFYKKNFKDFSKYIYLKINENILYAADNLGYVYAIDLKNESLVWAKNFGIPFRSNIKVTDGQVLLANQDNKVYSLDAETGNKNWQFSTSETFLKNDFKNNIAIDKSSKSLLFLNTNGELFSINYINQKINWVLNFKKSSPSQDSTLFLSQPIALKSNNLIVSTEKATISYSTEDSSKNWSLGVEAALKPTITSNHTFVLSKNNLLICVENKTGNVLWSVNILKNFEPKFKRKIGKFSDFKIVNNELNLFSKNGYLLSLNYNDGNLKYIKKISKKGINSEVVFLNNNMFLIDNKNKLLKFN